MRKTPCEYILWSSIPAIRKELAETMITQFGLNQRQTAEKLGITPSAVCQYLSKKRGKNDMLNELISQEIIISAERIIKNDDSMVVIETCRLCKLLKNSKEFILFCEHQDNQE